MKFDESVTVKSQVIENAGIRSQRFKLDDDILVTVFEDGRVSLGSSKRHMEQAQPLRNDMRPGRGARVEFRVRERDTSREAAAS